jgi:hypothetical protein
VRERERLTHWLLIVAAALVLHLALLLYIKPSVFTFFARTPAPPARPYTDPSQTPDAILSIPVELEDEAPEEPFQILSDNIAARGPDDRATQPALPEDRAGPGTDLDITDMVGDASRTLPQAPDAELLQTPPRPLQITWPDTHRPERCLGHQITVLIQVDERGIILQVHPEAANHPSDCVSAAVESARQIAFAPGTINGRPAKMWTRIRIDFRGHD